ncbi:hypothetical protein PARU111607_18090 [Palleronia rufa]
MSKLTKRFVESVAPEKKGHIVWDDDLKWSQFSGQCSG